MELIKDIIIGIDIGGTKIMVGAITSNGEVLGNPIKFSTNSRAKAETILNAIVNAVEDLLSALQVTLSNVTGIGIGCTGPLDLVEGKILDCPQLPTLQYFALRDYFENHFGVPIYMNNDANCLIYGETIFGTGKGKKNVLGFTLGTGIGCAIIMNGKIVGGATGNAGEVWISPYKDQTIEDFISGHGVSRIYESISGEKRTAYEILELCKNGNKAAMETWKIFGEHLSVAMSWAINLIDPEIVVLGGSITNAHEYFLPYLEEKLRQQICSVPASKTKIQIAELGGEAGFIGAACLVMENSYSVNY